MKFLCDTCKYVARRGDDGSESKPCLFCDGHSKFEPLPGNAVTALRYELARAREELDEAHKAAEKGQAHYRKRAAEAQRDLTLIGGERDSARGTVSRLAAQKAAVAHALGTTPSDSLWEQANHVVRQRIKAEADLGAEYARAEKLARALDEIENICNDDPAVVDIHEIAVNATSAYRKEAT